MSKYHGDQYWSNIRHQAARAWRDLSEDDYEPVRAIAYSEQVRARGSRLRARRDADLHPHAGASSRGNEP